METSGGYVINPREDMVSFSVTKAIWQIVSHCEVPGSYFIR